MMTIIKMMTMMMKNLKMLRNNSCDMLTSWEGYRTKVSLLLSDPFIMYCCCSQTDPYLKKQLTALMREIN